MALAAAGYRVRMTKARGGEVSAELAALAELMGVRTAYVDVMKQKRRAGAEPLMAVLRGMGVPVERPGDARAELRRVRAALAKEVCGGSAVGWLGKRGGATLGVDVTADLAGREVRWVLRGEDGREVSGTGEVEPAKREGARGRLRVKLPREVGMGYWDLEVRAGRRAGRSRVVVAPERCFEPEGGAPGELRTVAAFLPLYALVSERTGRCGGVGDLGDLRAACAWLGGLGVREFGTLPLLATFLDEPYQPSPYSPISRLVFGELWVDLESAAALVGNPPQALRRLGGAAFRRASARLAAAEHVDYRAAWRLKREVLRDLAQRAFADDRARGEMERFARERAGMDRYARFRAAVDKSGASWQSWGEAQRNGRLGEGDYEEADRRLYLFAQWALDAQLRRAAEEMRSVGCRAYLDLPVGVDGGGFDAWAYPGLFAHGVSVGAPPDPLALQGQNWGFPPMLPGALATGAGLGYFAEMVRSHLRFAGTLRLDHVMGLHRLFWIPEGFRGTEGVYVRYPAEAQYAVLSLESHRARARIVGENLGTVPPEAERALRRHGVLGMTVAQFMMGEVFGEGWEDVGGGTFSMVNTHDLPTFAAFWRGEDIGVLEEMGHVTPEDAARMRGERAAMRREVLGAMGRKGKGTGSEAEVKAVLREVLSRLARGPSAGVVVNLEDLWGETRPQNVPGTSTEHPNWTRRASRRLEEMRGVEEELRRVAEEREMGE